ncbi:MAG: BolA family transcriptional regulator [Rhodobacteraceae bacterium]|nr:BolA family transcriptional regulator [Paracoccaceae bacterium]
MTVSDEIRTRLEQHLAPSLLEVTDESDAHRGHAGYRPGGQSHFRLRIASAAFAGQSRLDRHRAIHAALGKDLMNRIHALAVDIVD